MGNVGENENSKVQTLKFSLLSKYVQIAWERMS